MTTSPHLLRMVAADVPAVARLLRASAEKFIVHEFAPAARAHFLSKNDAAAISRFVADGFRYHVAEADGTIVGFVGVRDDRHLYHLFVAESHQRRGIAGRLRDVAAAGCR
jgi:ribosomal protein S18 acetylase RimI-like enzyme